MATLLGAPAPVVGGRFEVQERLGEGGMGIVFAARDRKLGRRVALKFLHRTAASSEGRLLREARAMAQLDHRNVLPVFDVGEYEGALFIAMKLAGGGTIVDWLREQPRSLDEIVRVFADAARGLAAAHDAGFIHRDFKPSNVFIGDDGAALVGDFSLVSAEPTPPVTDTVSMDEPAAVYTVAGSIVGTPQYMAPEQRNGGEVTDRADQFAFGLSLYEAVYGTPAASNSPTANAPDRRPATGEAVPKRIRRVMARSTATGPSDRYPGMRRLLDELAPPPTNTRARLVAGGAVAVALAAGMAWWLEPEPLPGPPAPSNPYAVCFHQRLDGIYMEDALAGESVELGMVPFLDPKAPVRADDRAYDEDRVWRPRGRRIEVRNLADDEVVFDGYTTGTEPCVFFTHPEGELHARVTVLDEAAGADGGALFRAGPTWDEVSRHELESREGGLDHHLETGETAHVDVPDSAASRLLTLATFMVDARMKDASFGTRDQPHQFFLAVGAKSECGDHPCVRYGEEAPGVSSIHLSGADANRKYLLGYAFARAAMEQRLSRPWSDEAGAKRLDAYAPFRPAAPGTAAREGWALFVSAVNWNDRGPHGEGFFTLWPPACVPGDDGCEPGTNLNKPIGFPDRWHTNYVPLHEGPSMCAYWDEANGSCPGVGAAAEDSCAQVARSVTLDWARHFWHVATRAKPGAEPATLDELTSIVEVVIREKRDDANTYAAMTAQVPENLLPLWKESAKLNRVDTACP